MTEKLHSVRPGAGELTTWREAAQAAGKPLNRWIRDSLKLVADRDRSLLRQHQYDADQAARAESLRRQAPARWAEIHAQHRDEPRR